ncbi:MAG: beta strand repeat-containing protein, partial [Pseudanabaenaceae cyanobacterium]
MNITTNNGNLLFSAGNDPIVPADASQSGVSFSDGVVITTNGGSFTVNGRSNGSDPGVRFNGSISGIQVLTSGGNITLTGTLSSNVSAGVTAANTTFESGGGAIAVTGEGSEGIAFFNSQITAGAGNVTLNGTGTNGEGILLSGTNLNTTTGNVTATGTGGGSVSDGIRLATGSVQSTDGDLLFTGTSNGAGNGVTVATGATVTTTGSGEVQVTGEAVSGLGVLVDGTLSTINQKIQLRAPSSGINISGVLNSGTGEVEFLADDSLNVPGSVDTTSTVTIASLSLAPERGVSLGAPLPNTLQVGILSGLSSGIAELIVEGSGPITSNGFSITPDVRFIGSEFRTEGAATVGSGQIVVDRPARLAADLQASDDIELKGNVEVTGANVTVQSVTGDIDITGNVNGQTDGGNNLTLNASGGKVNVSGNLGTGTRLGNVSINSNNDVSLNPVQSTSLTVETPQGITLAGAVSTNGSGGVSLLGGDIDIQQPLTATGGGGLSVTSTGTFKVGSNAPVEVAGNLSQSGSGDVEVAGSLKAGGNIVFNGAVLMTDDTEFFAGGPLGIAFTGGLNAGGNNLTLGSEELDFGAPLSGVLNLTVQPFTATRPIVIGGTGNVPGSLTLTDLDLVNIQASNLTSLNIGNQASGNISFVSSFPAFNQDTTFASGNGATISAVIPILGNGSGSLTFHAGGNLTLENVTNPGNDITLISRAGNIDTTGGTLSTVGTNSGNITLQAANGGIALGNVTTEATTGNAGSLSFTAAQPLTLSGFVNLSANSGNGGNFTANLPVNLSGFTEIFTAGSGTSGNITFGQAVTGASSLGLQAGSGTINLNGDVSILSLAADTSGTINLGGNITTTSTQFYLGNVVLTQNVILTTSNSNVFFDGTVNGGRSFNLNVGTGLVELSQPVGGSTRLSSFTANPAATVTSDSAADIRTTGNIAIGTVDTRGEDTGQGVIPARPIALDSGSGNINVTTLNASSSVGQGASVTLQGSGAVNVGAIDTSGTTGGGSVTATGSGSFTSGHITTRATGSGTGGNVNLNRGSLQVGAIDASGPSGGGDVTLQSSANLTVGSVQTNATSSGAGGDISLQGGTIALEGDLLAVGQNGSGGKITATTAGNLTGTGVISASTVSSGNGGEVSLQGSTITLGGPVRAQSASGQGGKISLKGNVVTAQDLNAAGTTGGGEVVVDAVTQITVGNVNASASGGPGGQIVLDPTGDVVLVTANASGNSGGSIEIVSTGGNVRATGILNSPAACSGASICAAGTGGSVFIRHGQGAPNVNDLNFSFTAFQVGNASVNGTAGDIVAGSDRLSNQGIPNLDEDDNNTFLLGSLAITPGGTPSTPTPTP